MGRIIIASGTASGSERLGALISSAAEAETVHVRSEAELDSAVAEEEFDLVLINAPLADLYGDGAAQRIARGSTSAVILLVKGELPAARREKALGAGVTLLQKPFSSDSLLTAVSVSLAARERMLRLFRRTEELEYKAQEANLVGRAKCVLVQYLNMTEPQAHRYIEKQAMDRCITRREVAEKIVRTYS